MHGRNVVDPHLDVYKWLHQNGCPGSHRNVYRSLAFDGRLDFLQWMFDDGCRFCRGICASAAAGNQLHVLQWLRANDVPWDNKTILWAREEGHSDVEAWAIQNGCPGGDAPEFASDDESTEDSEDIDY